MSSRSIFRVLGIALLVIAFSPANVQACSACMGDANSNIAGAVNGAIFLMLGFIGGMLALLGGFAFYLMRRASRPLPPHAEFLIDHGQEGTQSHA